MEPTPTPPPSDHPSTPPPPPSSSVPPMPPIVPPPPQPPPAQTLPPQPQPQQGWSGFTCPYCKSSATPFQKKQLSAGGWVLFAVLLFFCIPLCWLPFVIDGCKE